MAGRQYLSNPGSPFFSIEDDDVDDETFLRNSRVPNTYHVSPSTEQGRAYLEESHQELLDRKRVIEERTIQSSERSLRILEDSEQIGVATAEELLRQREQLQRTDKMLDDINTTLRFSHKHIQGIKSVFGSLKNYLSGKSSDLQPPAKSKGTQDAASASGRESVLADMVDRAKVGSASTSDNHPGMRIRGLAGDSSPVQRSTNLDAQAVLDQNMQEMLGGLTRLRGLAINMGKEIDSQNDLLEDVIMKTDKADLTIDKQNKDMMGILKK